MYVSVHRAKRGPWAADQPPLVGFKRWVQVHGNGAGSAEVDLVLTANIRQDVAPCQNVSTVTQGRKHVFL